MPFIRAILAAAVAFAATGARAQRSEAILLVDSTSPRYAEAAQRIRPYLDHFGVPYTVLDVSTTPVGPEVGEYALVVVGHASLDPARLHLDAAEEAALSGAIQQGTGLVSFDGDLSAEGGAGRHRWVQDVFGFGYGPTVTGTGVAFAPEAPGHWISSRHAAGEVIATPGGMAAVTLVPPAGAAVLARIQSTGAPLLVASSYGQGRAVQWTSSAWASHAVLGPMHGMDDLVWRAMVWAARKPFVMQGLPNFVTMRVDDVVGGLWWARIAGEFGLKPWMGLFYGSISERDAADVASLVNAGLATASVHSRTADEFFYFDHRVSSGDAHFVGVNFPDSTVASRFDEATAWHAARGIPISRVVVPHFYEIGSNVFERLGAWGVEFVATQMTPGTPYASPWVPGGPYRLHETGGSNEIYPLAYADDLPVPGHPELAGRFFNCVTEIRDDAGYEWYPSADVGASIGRGARQLARAFDGMALATLFTHEGIVQSIPQDAWRAILAGVTAEVSGYAPIPVTLDDACRYLRAKHRSRILSSVHDPASGTLTTELGGSADVPTQLYVFTGSGDAILQTAVGVPAFTGTTTVARPVGAPLARVEVTPGAVTLDAGTSTRLTAQAYDVAGNPVLGLSYAWSAGAGGTVDANGVFTAGFEAGSFADAVAVSVDGRVGRASVQVVVPGTASLWPGDAAPAVADAGPDHPVELGVKFRSDMAGSITAIRFYKSSANGGVHVANLWTASGQLLSTATFTAETGAGWQQVTLPSPVPIAPNTIYVASYHTAVGHYALDREFFASSGRDRPPLHAVADGAAGGNGVYAYGPAGTFPRNSYAAANYWVDVVFTAQEDLGLFSGATPATLDRGADNAVELGVKFRSDVTGNVTGLRFYKSEANVGTHVGSLWTSAGQLLASATFTAETASGWQEVSFPAPVPIQANTVYVASYHTGVGHYSRDVGYFAAGRDNGPLHAPADGASGGNGVYAYGPARTFPSRTYLATNYWVDVIFTAGPVPALTSIAVSPGDAALPVGGTQRFAATGTYANGTTRDLTGRVTWASSNAGVATVDAEGLAVAVGGGAAVVSATLDGVTGAAAVAVQGAPSSGTTIWPGTALPARADHGPDGPVELGVRFHSDLAGTITGIRFYKAAANVGRHVGSLWTAGGQLLARAEFADETAAGWQEARFAEPVPIAANTVYVASYHTDVGHYAQDLAYFAGGGVDRPPLHALADGVAGGNGVYAYGATSTFPASTYLATNYWVDVVFSAQAAPTLTALAVTPATAVLETGGSVQLAATGTYSDGSTRDLTGAVAWSSSDGAVADVSGAGLARGVAAGSAAVSATRAGVTGTASLEVRVGPPAIATAALPDAFVGLPYAAALVATGGVPPYTWSVAPGALPPGLALSEGGTIAGTPAAVGAFAFTVTATDAASRTASATPSLTVVPGTGFTIWPASTAPARADHGPDAPVELGVRFRADASGRVTGIRFYKAATNGGTHVGTLWTSGGQLLATATFAAETASGWQEVAFPAPVPVAAGAVYVASYHTEVGHYAQDFGGLSDGRTSGPLRALADGEAGGNGLYAYGPAGTFPANSFFGTNYWVDVVFDATP